jgi:hypothetical protein
VWYDDIGYWIEFVEFDVAVTVTEGEKDKFNIGVAVMKMFGVGMANESDDSMSHVTKLKFRVPVVWPTNK